MQQLAINNTEDVLCIAAWYNNHCKRTHIQFLARSTWCELFHLVVVGQLLQLLPDSVVSQKHVLWPVSSCLCLWAVTTSSRLSLFHSNTILFHNRHLYSLRIHTVRPQINNWLLEFYHYCINFVLNHSLYTIIKLSSNNLRSTLIFIAMHVAYILSHMMTWALW